MESFSELIPPEYQHVFDLRGGYSIGGMPPTDAMFEFFRSVSNYTDVENILEFGFLYGMSAAIQLTVHPNANLTAYDVNAWPLDVGPRTFNLSLNSPELASFVWGDRFTFNHRSSKHALKEPKGHYDYVFIDGLHTCDGCYTDIKTAYELEIPYVFIDNLMYLGVHHAIEKSDLRLVDELWYDQYNPLNETWHSDRIGLYSTT